MGRSIYDEVSGLSFPVFIDAAATTTMVTIVPVQTADFRVDAIVLTSYAGATGVVRLNAGVPTAYYPLGAVSIPVNAGDGTVPGVDLVQVIAPVAVGGWVIPIGQALVIQVTVSLTGVQAILGVCLGGFF